MPTFQGCDEPLSCCGALPSSGALGRAPYLYSLLAAYATGSRLFTRRGAQRQSRLLVRCCPSCLRRIVYAMAIGANPFIGSGHVAAPHSRWVPPAQPLLHRYPCGLKNDDIAKRERRLSLAPEMRRSDREAVRLL